MTDYLIKGALLPNLLMASLLSFRRPCGESRVEREQRARSPCSSWSSRLTGEQGLETGSTGQRGGWSAPVQPISDAVTHVVHVAFEELIITLYLADFILWLKLWFAFGLHFIGKRSFLQYWIVVDWILLCYTKYDNNNKTSTYLLTMFFL